MNRPSIPDPAVAAPPDLRRLLWATLLFLALGGLGIWVIQARIGGPAVVWDARLLQGSVVASLAGLLLLYWIADGLRLWFCLRTLGERIPLRDLGRLVFINLFVSSVTPMATGGGVAQVWFLRRRGIAVGTALTATTVRTLLAACFIFAAAPVLVALIPERLGLAEDGPLLRILLAAVGLYALGVAILLLRTRWLTRSLLWMLTLLRRARMLGRHRHLDWRRRLARELARFTREVQGFLRGPPRFVLASVLATAVFLLALFSFPVLLLDALGQDPRYWTVIGRVAVTTLIMYFAPTPGASGIAEGAFGTLFADLLSASHLVLVTLVWRILTIHLGVFIGIFATHRELTRGPAGASS
ncbi:MAG: lysylphosphatidylglycerol synthase transmembrane domain-containing protein [Gammaproteobacteria bacterium]|nr:lysylphosphatidylglycerol synthase transmembrane domain-containing protein [Gammaproteobacteria bacterium]